ncbi:sarcocystatin-A-like [Musca autumnalis]|uniref:sarcocystatin-A-like n=1 Tax=Musca autumnalis TaxID=221902 RepID=UPI003CF67ED6
MGGRRELPSVELMSAEHELRSVLMKLAESDDGPAYRIGAVFAGSEQLVAGSLKTLVVTLLDLNNLKHNCEVDLWSRPWQTDGTEVTIRCECMRTIFKHVDY